MGKTERGSTKIGGAGVSGRINGRACGRADVMQVFKLLEGLSSSQRVGGGAGMLTIMISDANPGTSTLFPPY